MELIFLGVPDKVKYLDNGQQVTAWDFTLAANKYVFRHGTPSFFKFSRGKKQQKNENIQKRQQTRSLSIFVTLK